MRRYDDDPRDDEDDEYDDPDDSDEIELPDGVYHDDALPTIACPHCREEILEDAQWCPHCEHHLSKEDASTARKSPFWIIMMILALFCAAVWAGFL